MTENHSSATVMPEFKSLKYERPSVDRFREVVREVRLRIMTSQDPDVAAEALLEYEKELSKFDTAYALCNILHDMDTSNDYYTEELEFFDEASASVSELSAAVLTGMLNCPCADQLRAK